MRKTSPGLRSPCPGKDSHVTVLRGPRQMICLTWSLEQPEGEKERYVARGRWGNASSAVSSQGGSSAEEIEIRDTGVRRKATFREDERHVSFWESSCNIATESFGNSFFS